MDASALTLIDGWIEELGAQREVGALWRSLATWCGADAPPDGAPVGEADRRGLGEGLARRLSVEVAQLRAAGDGDLADALASRVARLRAASAPPASGLLGGVFANALRTSPRAADVSRGYRDHLVLVCPGCGAPQRAVMRFRCPYCGGLLGGELS